MTVKTGYVKCKNFILFLFPKNNIDLDFFLHYNYTEISIKKQEDKKQWEKKVI